MSLFHTIAIISYLTALQNYIINYSFFKLIYILY